MAPIRPTRPNHGRTAESPRNSPSVVLLVLDEPRFDDFGDYGLSVFTPHIDRLAPPGLRHSNLHVTPVSGPARARPPRRGPCPRLVAARNAANSGLVPVLARHMGPTPLCSHIWMRKSRPHCRPLELIGTVNNAIVMAPFDNGVAGQKGYRPPILIEDKSDVLAVVRTPHEMRRRWSQKRLLARGSTYYANERQLETKGERRSDEEH